MSNVAPIAYKTPPTAKVETLREKQSRFVLMKAKLILYAYGQGYELTDGDAFRDERVHGKQGEQRAYGEANSAHKWRLAQDFNLFKNGVWLQDTSDHLPLGLYWESIGGSWGGRFQDGNHYSLAHRGVK